MNLRDRMQVKLVDAKQEVNTLSVMALNPSLPPEYRQLVRMLECLASKDRSKTPAQRAGSTCLGQQGQNDGLVTNPAR